MKPVPKQYGIRATLASVVVALALTACGGGDDSGISGDELATKGPPDHSNSPNAGDYGASIDVFNTCELASDPDTSKPVLRVTTTITEKSSGDISADLTVDGTTVRAKEKGKGNDTYESVHETAFKQFTPVMGANYTDIQLCDENGFYLGPDDTVSLNASVTVNVDNDNKGEYANRCSDDPETPADEGKVIISAAELNQLCMLP